MTVAVLMCCGTLGWLLAGIVARRRSWSWPRRALLALAACLLLVCALAAAYLGVYYHADATALEACEGSELVDVRHEDGRYFFDGPGSDTALVFLPGAKVEAQAYAPLMLRLAEQGIDCYLMDPFAHMAFFSAADASRILEQDGYRHMLVGGHSLGGIVAASCANEHPNEAGAVVLLASYPTSELPDSTVLLSVYGSEDGCLERSKYDAERALWPPRSQELVIEGGNHAGFGNYGHQRGDAEALISASEQQELTSQAILDVAKHLSESP